MKERDYPHTDAFVISILMDNFMVHRIFVETLKNEPLHVRQQEGLAQLENEAIGTIVIPIIFQDARGHIIAKEVRLKCRPSKHHTMGSLAEKCCHHLGHLYTH
jgi:23S rRNA-/tRNA-specific pseudouridylate synthase